MQQMNEGDTVTCPRCGQEIKLQRHPDKPLRLIGVCNCNPAGPVMETNVAPTRRGRPQVQQEDVKEEVE